MGFLSVLDRRGRSPGARDPPGGTDDLQLGPMAVLELVLELVLVPVAGAASLEPRPGPTGKGKHHDTMRQIPNRVRVLAEPLVRGSDGRSPRWAPEW